jgi:hypothetical protein
MLCLIACLCFLHRYDAGMIIFHMSTFSFNKLFWNTIDIQRPVGENTGLDDESLTDQSSFIAFNIILLSVSFYPLDI